MAFRWLAVFAVTLLSGCSYLMPDPDFGPTADGQLQPCPPQPHCVSSQGLDDTQHISALQLKQASEQGWQALLNELSRFPRTRVITVTPNYVHAAVHTPSHLFTDDLELLRDNHGRVQLRSASRVGYHDFGANRKRVENLRQHLIKAGVILPAQ